MRAIQYSWVISAKYDRSNVNIFLMKGTHYILPTLDAMTLDSSVLIYKDGDNIGITHTLQPLVCGTSVNAIPQSQNCYQVQEKVVVKNKAGPWFKLKVSEKMTIKNMVVDSLDSALLENIDPLNTLNNQQCSRLKADCCGLNEQLQIMTNAPGQSVNCSSTIFTPESVQFETGTGFMFEIIYTPRRTPLNVGVLEIDGVEFKNFFYHFHSIVQVRDFGHYKITNCKFMKIRSSGTFISNKYPFNTPTEETPPLKYLKVAQLRSLRVNQLSSSYRTKEVTGCATTPTACLSVTITTTLVTQAHYGILPRVKHTQTLFESHAVFVYLTSLNGGVSMVGNVFTQNHIFTTDCNIRSQKTLPTTSMFYKGNNQYRYQGFIYIQQMRHAVEIIGCTFKENSGFSLAMVHVTKYENGTKAPFIALNNHFEGNSGLYFANYIEMYDKSDCGGIKIATTPGYKINGVEVKFIRNLNCPIPPFAHLIAIRCYKSLNQSAKVYNKKVLTSPSGVKYFDKAVELNGNQYQRNYYNAESLVRVEYASPILLNSERYKLNVGSIFLEAVIKHSPFKLTMRSILQPQTGILAFPPMCLYVQSILTTMIYLKECFRAKMNYDEAGPPTSMQTHYENNFALFNVIKAQYPNVFVFIRTSDNFTGGYTNLQNINFHDMNGLSLDKLNHYQTPGVTFVQIQDEITVAQAGVGATTYRHGEIGPLIAFNVKKDGHEATLNNAIVNSAYISKSTGSTNIYIRPGFLIHFNVDGTKPIQKLHITNCVVSNLYTKGVIDPVLKIQQLYPGSVVNIKNLTIDKFGQTLDGFTLTSAIELYGIPLTTTSDPPPEVVIDGFICTNGFSYQAQCIMLIPYPAGTPHLIKYKIINSMFKGNQGNKGSIYTLPDTARMQFELVIDNCTFQSSESNTDGLSQDIMINDAIPGSLVKITNNRFTDFSQKKKFTLGRSVSVLFTSNTPTQKVYLENNFFDCGKGVGTFTDDHLRQNQFFESTDRSQYDNGIVYLLGIIAYSTNNTIQNCYDLLQGGLVVKRGVLYDTNSMYQNITAQDGGCISINEGSGKILNSTMLNCRARRGGAISFNTGHMLIENCTIKNSFAKLGGGMYATNVEYPNKQLTLLQMRFESNIATDEGAAFFVTFSETDNVFIRNSTFTRNKAEKGGVVTVQEAYLQILQGTKFLGNSAVTGMSGVYAKIGRVTIDTVTFDSLKTLSQIQSQKLGQTQISGHIFVVTESTLTVNNCQFIRGFGKQGGAIRINGFASATITNSQFIENYAHLKGGSIRFSGIDQATLTGNVITDSFAGEKFMGGDSIYADGGGKVTTQNVQISYSSNKYPINVVYLSGMEFIGNQISIKIKWDPASGKQRGLNLGGGIHAIAPTKFALQGSTIEGAKWINNGGGISIGVLLDSQNTNNTHSISNSTIQNNQAATSGGGIYIRGIRYMDIDGSTITNNLCKQNGGGIAYESFKTGTSPKLNILNSTKLHSNTANIQGGGIYWNYHTPTTVTSDMQGNTAKLYGDDKASYAHQLLFTSQSTYEQVMKGKRYLSLVTLPQTAVSNIMSQKSGGVLPSMYVALVDEKGFVVASDSSSKATLKVRITSAYTNSLFGGVVLKGPTSVVAEFGIYKFEGITIVADPGVQFEFYVETDGIDKTLPQNIGQGTSSTQTFFSIQMRNCSIGESLQASGECKECTVGEQYSLTPVTKVSECKPCVHEKMYCLGGSNIGPRRGYWRSSNTSSNFLQCLNQRACLGMVKPHMNPIGQCEVGFEGILCGKCQHNYSVTGSYNCSKCPNLILNIIRLLGLTIAGIIVIVVIIKSTIAGAKQIKNAQSVYLKILMNHLQLIVLTSSFDFQWPDRVLKFFEATKPAANVSTQFLSVDCLLFFLKDEAKKLPQFNLYYQKLIIYGVVPLIMCVSSFIFWRLYLFRDPQRKRRGRTIASIIIMLFLIHPSIVQKMFDSFNCTQVDAERRVMSELDIICFNSNHIRWSAAVSFPSIVLWGLGIPFFASFVLFQNRSNLKKLSTREKYGFLYNGYKNSFFYWETVIMYRKIIIIAIAVYLRQLGTITQALVVFMLLTGSLFTNIKVQPFSTKRMNDMETYSIIASILTVYCGMFYIYDKPEVYNSPNEDVKIADNGMRLNSGSRTFLFLIIIGSNGLFFMYWVRNFIGEVQNLLRTKFEKVYLLLCLCGRKEALKKEKELRALRDENEVLREEFEAIVNQVQKLYETERIILNPKVLEKLSVALNPQKLIKEMNYKSAMSHLQPEDYDLNTTDISPKRKRHKPLDPFIQDPSFDISSTNTQHTNITDKPLIYADDALEEDFMSDEVHQPDIGEEFRKEGSPLNDEIQQRFKDTVVKVSEQKILQKLRNEKEVKRMYRHRKRKLSEYNDRQVLDQLQSMTAPKEGQVPQIVFKNIIDRRKTIIINLNEEIKSGDSSDGDLFDQAPRQRSHSIAQPIGEEFDINLQEISAIQEVEEETVRESQGKPDTTLKQQNWIEEVENELTNDPNQTDEQDIEELEVPQIQEIIMPEVYINELPKDQD